MVPHCSHIRDWNCGTIAIVAWFVLKEFCAASEENSKVVRMYVTTDGR
jgi:hypothetical protein